MGECESNWTGSHYVFPHVVRINWSPLYVFPYVVRIHSGEINLILLSKERASGKRLAIWRSLGNNDNNCPDNDTNATG